MDRDPTFSIPEGSTMMAFTEQMYEQPEKLKQEAERRLRDNIAFAEGLQRQGGLLDGFALCSDYCFNVNPFFSRDMFAEFISPYLSRAIAAYHSMGYTVIKHTDGNIMPIIDMLVECGPDALHSLDPQGGVDLARVSREYGDRVALIGNVNCGLLQTGTEEACAADVRRALREGMRRGSGYVFSTSNCAYTGLALERYELMNRIWFEEGIYAGEEKADEQ
jgi:uroporphyrinogen decarboxylase